MMHTVFLRLRHTVLCLATLCLAHIALAQSGSERLVSTDAAATEIILALGAGDRLVAVDITSPLPDELAQLPRIGYHRALAAEGILALNPDLVIGSEHMGPPHVLKALRGAGVELLQLPSANSLATVAANVRTVAARLGVNDAQALMPELAPSAQFLQTAAPLSQTAVFILNGEGGKMRLAGRNTTGDAFIHLLGLENAAQHANFRVTSAEALLELAPDIILVADIENAGSNAILQGNPVLRYSDALKNNRLYTVDASALVAGLSLAAIEDAAQLRRQLEADAQPR